MSLVSDVLSTAAGLAADLLAPVRYRFSCPDGPAADWHVRRLDLRERLSAPYHLTLELSTADVDAPVDELLGATCTTHIERLLAGRRVHGVIHRVERLGTVAGRLRVRLSVAPALWLLSQRRDTRFWQRRTALEILQDVLTEPLAAYHRTLTLQLDASAVRPREYCVQYRETDLEFAERLLHEEGLVYMFDHAGDAERLVIVDTTVAAPDLALPPIPLFDRGTGTAREQSVDTLDTARTLTSTSIVQRDWDWQETGSSPYTRPRRRPDERRRERELYDHDDRRLAADDGDRRALHKLEQAACAQQLGHGSSDVVEFVPGACFQLRFHPRLELDGRHLLVEVHHTGEAPEELLHAAAAGPRYHNEFRSLRPDIPWRAPTPPPRPRAAGPHTAIVVGPAGEEIHTDAHGRIKVCFHWDRRSPLDDTASCWIRVAQTWAGAAWGAQFLPRIGMEVLVEFIDGDPERPIVAGCVYNGLHHPPYTLPDHKTQSGLKSESSPGGGGFNELRFEDAKGAEEIFFHAQRDLTEVVLRNNTRTVGVDQSFSIGSNQSFTVGADQTFTVTGNRSVTVTDGDESLTVAQGKSDTTVQLDRAVTVVAGNSSHTVQAGSHTLTAHTNIAVTAETADLAVTAKTSVAITAETTTLDLTGNAAVTVQSNTSTLTLTAPQPVSLDSSTSTLALTGFAAVAVSSTTATIGLAAPVAIGAASPLISVAAGVHLGMSGALVTVDGTSIVLTATSELTLQVGPSAICLKPDGITISAPKISSEAVGKHTISGALIELN